MAGLILPRRFTSQPQGAVEVDSNNSFADKLIAYTGASQLKNNPTDAVTLTGTAAFSPNDGGMALNTGSDGLARISDSSSWTFPDTQKLSFAFVGIINYVDSPWGGVLVKRRANNTLAGPMLARDSSNDWLRIYNGNSYCIANTFALSSIFGKRCVLFVTLIGSGGVTTAKLYVNGVNVYTGTITNWINTDSTGDLVVGSENTANLTYSSGVEANLITAWNGRALSDIEVVEFSSNPWQIFRAPKRTLYFDVSTPGIPTLSLPGVDQITTTGARPYVSLGF